MRPRLQWRENPFDTLSESNAGPFALSSEFDGEGELWEVAGLKPVAVETPGGGRIQNKTPPQPADLVTVRGVGGKHIQLHRLAAEAWQASVSAARADGIREPLLLPVSGYRNPVTQERLWRQALQKYGSPQEARKWVAPPGSSAHQTGRAIDFYLGGQNSSAHVSRLRRLPAYTWLASNAKRFGFYPYEREPWHWEYNPPAGRQSELFPESFETFELPDAYEDEGVDIPAQFASQFEYEFIEPSEVVYDVESGQPYGPRWRTRRPPGLPAYARLTSKPRAALPYIERLARAQAFDEVFVTTVRHLAETESGGMFALPAHTFDARPKAQRPAGKSLITAWGTFQFNRDAWRSLPGVGASSFPWDSTPYEEISRPILQYAKLFSDIIKAGGAALDAARGIRLWHRTPRGFAQYLSRGRQQGFPTAWAQVDASHRNIVERHLRSAGTV